MFCPNCGKENNQKAAFCAECGAVLATLTAPAGFTAEINQAARRQDLLTGLGVLATKVNEKADTYERLKEAQRQYLSGKEGLKGSAGKTFAAISACIGAMMVIWAIEMVVSSIADPANRQPLIVVMFLLAFGGGALIPQICYSVSAKGHKKRIAFAEKWIPELNQELVEFYKTIPNNPLVYEYTNPDTIYALSQLIYLGKADSIKEAILCLDDERYRQSVQGQLAQILAAEKQTRNAMIAGDVLLAALAL